MASLIPVAATVDVSAVEQDNIYAGTSNTMRAAFQALGAQQNKLSLPSKRLGANQQLNLVSGPLLGFTMLALRLDKTGLIANVGLEEGWGYRAISYLEMSMGDSTTLRISGDHLLQKVLADCENENKRQNVLTLGGNAKVAVATPGTNDLDSIAYVALPLPFSNTGASRSLMFDSSILQRPVTIRIQFATPEQLFLKVAGTTPTFPTEFKDVYVVSKTAILTNPSQSIRDLVGPSGPASYSQPWMFPNSWTSSQTIGSYPQSGTALASVRMDSFQNGSVQSIDLWLRLETYLDGVTLRRTADVPYPSTAYLPMRDISVLYGGQVMWQSDDETDALISLSEYGAGASFGSQIPTALDGSSPATFVSKWYHVQLALQNEVFFSNLIQSGANLVNNTVEVRFHTPELPEVKAPAAGEITQPTFRLYANVNYQAAVRVSKGSASFDFVPPIPLLQGTITGNVPNR
jgi:hypothetical protein